MNGPGLPVYGLLFLAAGGPTCFLQLRECVPLFSQPKANNSLAGIYERYSVYRMIGPIHSETSGTKLVVQGPGCQFYMFMIVHVSWAYSFIFPFAVFSAQLLVGD